MKFPRLTEDHVWTVCRPGEGAATCRYLGSDGSGWRCLKLLEDYAAMLDERAAEGTIQARGDNCEGRES